MKNHLNLALVCLCLLSSLSAISQRNCGTMEHLEHLKEHHPRSEEQMEKIEEHTNRFVQNYSQNKSGQVITIPVVVHVVYNTNGENISDNQVQSQIDVLNEDFRRTNADASNTPSYFSNSADDMEIEFCLASYDPNGNPTSGITRTYTSNSSFSTNDNVKYDNSGGKNAWPADQYLNIWVCDLSGGTLGYAQFPGSGSAATDGVVINYKYFGRNGSAQAPFNKGRTATHEVGHWLNLRHIWGDGGCSYDDYVNDTPIASQSHYGCPSWPTSTCSSYDMYMNYMDYVDDACMNMFTTGQKTRMHAQFAPGGYRESLLSSTACSGNTGPASYCGSSGNDASYEWIANVKVGGLNHASGNDNGYKDNTYLSEDLAQGSSYMVELTPGFASSTYNEYWKIWIDYNQDLDFDDPGELVFDAGSMSSSMVNGSFTVPQNAPLGNTRMRVSMKYNGAQTACEAFNYGEVEDYTVKIGSPQTPTSTYCIAKGLDASYEWIANVSLGDINNNSGNDGGYANNTSISTDLEKGAAYTVSLSPGFSGQTYNEYWKVWIDYNNDGDFTDAGELAFDAGSMSTGTVTGSITVPSNVSTGSKRMRVIMRYNAAPSSCGTFDYGEVEDYKVNIVESVQQVNYCNSQGSNSSYEWIAGVQIGSINNNSGNDGGYYDFTSISTDLSVGSSTNITLSPGFSGQVYNEYWKIWIDFNKDGDFTDAGEQVYTSGGLSSSTVIGSLNIPSNVPTGLTRMRVSMKYNGAPSSCETFSYGEVEDYSVNITPSGAKEIPNQEVSAEVTLASEPTLSVYPNPANNDFTLSLTGFEKSAEIMIMDLQGRVLYHTLKDIENSTLIQNIDVSGLTTGTYLVVVRENDNVLQEKIVLIK